MEKPKPIHSETDYLHFCLAPVKGKIRKLTPELQEWFKDYYSFLGGNKSITLTVWPDNRLTFSFDNKLGWAYLADINPATIPKPIELNLFGSLTVAGNNILLPETQLNRDDYLLIKNTLENSGGIYNTQIKGFSFTINPASLLKELQAGNKVNLKKDFQFFATPPKVVDKLIDKIIHKVKDGDKVLEPSAGQGAIADALKQIGLNVDCCEIMEENKNLLIKNGHNIIADDFLTLPDKPAFDIVVANPPFTNNQDIDHVYKMYNVLNKNGTMSSIMSTTWVMGTQKKQREFKLWLDTVSAEVSELPKESFKESGTNIPTVLVTLTKK